MRRVLVREVSCPVLGTGGEDRSISKQAALERAELLHSRTIGVSDDFRKKKALQEEEERKARVAKRKARSFLGKDSRAASTAESRRDDSSVVSVPAFSPEEQTAPVEDAYGSFDTGDCHLNHHKSTTGRH